MKRRPLPYPELDLSDCPYYRGVPGGVCATGCWQEPACVTEEPRFGWPSEATRSLRRRHRRRVQAARIRAHRVVRFPAYARVVTPW